jgi:zinc protease
MYKLVLSLFAAAGLTCAAGLNIPIERYTLANGMRVVLSPDNTAPVVSVYVIYGVGSRSEQKGRTGFAHLFEHMMFQGSKNVAKAQHFQIVQANGGNLNGSTHPDYTDYFEVLPSNKLAVGLWLESDRMRGLNITEENLSNQKEAVKQERRLNFDNQPYNTAIVDVWPQITFKNWSNSHSLIGSFEDLNAATVADVSEFFKTHYAPNNAVLCIAGDIQVAEAKKLIETYFADIASQPQPKGPDLTEPEQTEARSQTYKDALAQVPALIAGWAAPKRRSADYYALGMLDVLFSGGDASRLQQNLVKGKQSVISYEANIGWPFASASDYVWPGDYAMQLLFKPNFTSDQILDQLTGEIGRIQKEGVPAKELDRARTFFRASRYNQLMSVQSRASLLAQYELFDHDPNLINTELDSFLAVTPEQIQAVASKYLTPARRSTLTIVPAASQTETKTEAK